MRIDEITEERTDEVIPAIAAAEQQQLEAQQQ